MKELLEKLIRKEDLTFLEVKNLFEEALTGQASIPQLSAALALLRAKPEAHQELASAANIVLSLAGAIKRPSYEYGDIVGTGGDGFNTINVSTLASLVAAACGVKVAKHGNVSVSSKCGSADLLRELGIALDNDGPKAIKSMDENNWSFLFAPNFHPSFKHVKTLRQSLGIKTIFNLLGPLVNPLRPDFMVVGVYEERLLPIFAETLRAMQVKKALVVHGSGLDELCLHGKSQAVLLKNGLLEPMEFSVQDFGLKPAAISAVVGSEPSKNAELSLQILRGQSDEAKTSLVALSAGALIWLANEGSDLKTSVKKAQELILSGKAMNLIERLKKT